MFLPKEILYEENIKNYDLGRMLLEKYKDIPKPGTLSFSSSPSS